MRSVPAAHLVIYISSSSIFLLCDRDAYTTGYSSMLAFWCVVKKVSCSKYNSSALLGQYPPLAVPGSLASPLTFVHWNTLTFLGGNHPELVRVTDACCLWLPAQRLVKLERQQLHLSPA